MIGKYKIIALCTCRVQDNECHKFINDLHQGILKLGHRLFVYTSCSEIKDGKEQNDGQTPIYDLIDSSFIDAIVIQADRIKNLSVCKKIINRAQNSGLPVIVLGNHFDGCINIGYDYKSGFAKVVEHLVADHGITDIHMIAGMKDNSYSDDRISAFREVLTKHGIPFNNDMVSYGDFWSMPAVDATRKLMKSGKLPRAFVCANDYMAVAVADYLKSHGLSIPDDIIVTGYDGSSLIYASEPTLTSVSASDEMLTDSICEILSDVLEHGPYEKNVSVIPQLLCNESCGCPCTKKNNAAMLFNEQHNLFFRFQDENIILSDTTAEIQKCDELDEIPFVMRKSDMMYGMCCLLKNEYTEESVTPEKTLEQGYGDELLLLYDADMIDSKKAHGEKFEPCYIPKKDIIPSLDYYLNDGRILIFAPLYYLDVPMGYLCFYFSDYLAGNYYKVPQTTNVLNNALGGLRILRHQHYLLKQIDNMSRVDVLTGLYNRRGFLFEYNKLIETKEDDSLTVIMCDVDRLKYVNDTFGHEAGDIAIHTTAQALKQACPENAICTRFGGDEMMAVFTGRSDDNELQAMFDQYLSDFNTKSGVPYTVSASIGIYHTMLKSVLSFEDLVKKSDVLMYKEKRRKKQ